MINSILDKIKRDKLEKKVTKGEATEDDYIRLFILLRKARADFEKVHFIMGAFAFAHPQSMMAKILFTSLNLTQLILDVQSKDPMVIANHTGFEIWKSMVNQAFSIMKDDKSTWKPNGLAEMVYFFAPQVSQLYYMKGLVCFSEGNHEEAQKHKSFAFTTDKTGEVKTWGIY